MTADYAARRRSAIDDLDRAGRVPGTERRFRRRIVLHIKCAARHHDLANVYATVHGPLFVKTWISESVDPSVQRRNLLANWERELAELPADERGQHRRPTSSALRRVVPRHAIPFVGIDHTIGEVAGGWLLTDEVLESLRSKELVTRTRLKCRCGKWQQLDDRLLAEAMLSGATTLLV